VRPGFGLVFPGDSVFSALAYFASPSVTELRRFWPSRDRSGDERFCTAFLSVSIALMAFRAGLKPNLRAADLIWRHGAQGGANFRKVRPRS
jgi:hypothetical protein